MPLPMYTSDFADNVLTDLKTAVTGRLDGAIVRLFANDFQPTKGSVVADFTEAAFPGYAEIVAVWNAAVINEGDNRQITTQLLVWVANNDSADETIYGWYLVDASGADLIAAQRFDASVPIAADGDDVQAVAVMQL